MTNVEFFFTQAKIIFAGWNIPLLYPGVLQRIVEQSLRIFFLNTTVKKRYFLKNWLTVNPVNSVHLNRCVHTSFVTSSLQFLCCPLPLTVRVGGSTSAN